MNIFREFMAHMGFNNKQVNKAGSSIGMTGDRSIRATSNGERDVTHTERLAMSAVAAGLEPWAPENHDKLVAIRAVAEAIGQVPQAAKNDEAA